MQQFDRLHLALFSGKGGVGKTTVSCGFARQWAYQHPDRQILLLSTDPAHSLGDVLQQEVTDMAHPLPDLPNLAVRALDAQKLLQTFRDRHGRCLELLVERGSFVDGDDLQPVWNLGWPGLDELMSLLEIGRLLHTPQVDRIVVDMAPTGHTLTLLGLMDFLDSFLAALEQFQEKHRVISQTFGGSAVPDDADRFLADLKAELHTGRQLLQDPVQTGCFAVAIPEPMSYLETRRLLHSLEELHIPIGGIFVNRVSEFDRAAEQQEVFDKFLVLADDRPIFTLPQQMADPIGASGLDALMTQLQPLVLGLPAIHTKITIPEKLLPSLEDFVTTGRRLLLVGGKGGVGKTTVAAAIGWGLAARHPDRTVRVVSIDPAHSLGDALGQSLSHTATAITANLSAQEVDARQILDQFREDYLWELAEMMSGDLSDDSIQIAYGPQAWRQIVAQALPGIEEMLALLTVIELLESGQDLIILDTAPTGHLLRFLEMPTALGDWLSWIFKLWIKYQDVVGRTAFMGRLRTLRQRVLKAQKLLTDPQHTELIAVMQAQSAIVAETQRLSRSLQEMGVSQRYWVQNRYSSQQPTYGEEFAETIVKLSAIPGSLPPLSQIQTAANLLFP